MKDARVWRALKDDTERSGTDRASDVARELRAVARRHEHERVFRDGVLRIGHGPGPELVETFGHERRGPTNESDAPPSRFAVRQHETDERIAMPCPGDRLPAVAA